MSPSSQKVALGIRLNNPGNIRYNQHNRFIGLADPPQEKGFCRFTEPKYGIRAIMVVIRNYMRNYNLRSIVQIITRYAPPEDNNNTSKYIKDVSHLIAVQIKYREQYFPVTQPLWWSSSIFLELIRAIMLIECNYEVSQEELIEAFNLLDVPKDNSHN